jgi:hypothetical protein
VIHGSVGDVDNTSTKNWALVPVLARVSSRPPKLALQKPVLLDQVGDRLPLSALEPAVSTLSTICSAAGSITGSRVHRRHV